MSYKHIAIAQLDIDSVIHVVKMLSCEEGYGARDCCYITTHSAYVATLTEPHRVKIYDNKFLYCHYPVLKNHPLLVGRKMQTY